MRTSGRFNAHDVARRQVGQGTPHSQGHLDRSTEDNQDGIVLSRAVATGPVGRGTAHHPHHDTIVDGLGKGYSQDSEMGDDEDSFGQEAIGTSPLISTSPFLADAVTIAPRLMQHKNQRPRKHTTYATVNLSK